MDPAIRSTTRPPDRAGASRARIPHLDVARGWAILGVVMTHSLSAPSAGSPQATGEDMASTIIETANQVLFEGVSRALLAVLLGIGLVLTWSSAVERGASPLWLLVRRYVSLFVVIGLPHWYFFRPDILTHYALVVLVLLPLLPWMLRGARWRPLAVAAACVPVNGVLQIVAPSLPGYPFELVKASLTLGALAVGAWIVRLPELADLDPDPDADPGGAGAARRRARRISGWGVGVAVAGVASLLLARAVVGQGLDDRALPPIATFTLTVTASFAFLALFVGRALLYFGLGWWLADRGRGAARVLGVLAPLGRMSLTVYLGSTLLYLGGLPLFLLATGLEHSDLTLPTQFAVGIGYFAAMAVACPLWLRAFRYGPVEWLWRCMTHLRPLPLRRSTGPTR